MVGFAVIGLGMGKNRAKLIKETSGAELKVLIDLNTELAEGVGRELETDWTTNYDEALERKDVDVVLVMTPSGTHADLGIMAAKAEKHVICTKPMDVSTKACDRLIEACTEAGVLCGVDYQSRYIDNNVRVAEALRQGWLGKPILGEVRFKWFRAPEYFEASGGWRGTWAMDGGGSLANQGAHLIDYLLWLMGDAKTVYAETDIMNHEIETEDIGLAIVNFVSGAKGSILGTTTFPNEDNYGSSHKSVHDFGQREVTKAVI